MKIVFSGIPVSVKLSDKKVSVLEINNNHLFAEICNSLLAKDEELREIPFSLWNEDKEIKPEQNILYIDSPLSLPWDDKRLNNKFLEYVSKEINLDEQRRSRIIDAVSVINKEIFQVSSGFNASYELKTEWDMAKYLKMSHFSAEKAGRSFFDNQIEFLNFISDASFRGAVIFVNLKKFFTQEQYVEWSNQVIFLAIQTLLIETETSIQDNSNEHKQVVDLLDCSEIIFDSVGMDVSLQGRFCDKGFGAVTF